MRKSICAAVAAVLLLGSGCGTLFFSERIGKKMSRQIDRRVFVTNCILPGVVAFVLDYDNETIYYTEAELIPDDFMDYKGSFKMQQIPCKELDIERAAGILSGVLGKEITPLQLRLAAKQAPQDSGRVFLK